MILAGYKYQAGIHKVEWNGKNEMGVIVPSGIYFIRIKTAFGTKIIKSLFIK